MTDRSSTSRQSAPELHPTVEAQPLVVEQEKLDTREKDYVVALTHSLARDGVYTKDITADQRHIERDLENIFVMPGWLPEAHKLAERMAEVARKLPETSSNVRMRVTIAMSTLGPTSVPEVEETTAVGVIDSIDGVLRSCVTSASESTPPEDMTVRSGIVWVCQLVPDLIDAHNDNRVFLGPGPGNNVFAPRNRDPLKASDDDDENDPTSTRFHREKIDPRTGRRMVNGLLVGGGLENIEGIGEIPGRVTGASSRVVGTVVAAEALQEQLRRHAEEAGNAAYFADQERQAEAARTIQEEQTKSVLEEQNRAVEQQVEEQRLELERGIEFRRLREKRRVEAERIGRERETIGEMAKEIAAAEAEVSAVQNSGLVAPARPETGLMNSQEMLLAGALVPSETEGTQKDVADTILDGDMQSPLAAAHRAADQTLLAQQASAQNAELQQVVAQPAALGVTTQAVVGGGIVAAGAALPAAAQPGAEPTATPEASAERPVENLAAESRAPASGPAVAAPSPQAEAAGVQREAAEAGVESRADAVGATTRAGEPSNNIGTTREPANSRAEGIGAEAHTETPASRAEPGGEAGTGATEARSEVGRSTTETTRNESRSEINGQKESAGEKFEHLDEIDEAAKASERPQYAREEGPVGPGRENIERVADHEPGIDGHAHSYDALNEATPHAEGGRDVGGPAPQNGEGRFERVADMHTEGGRAGFENSGPNAGHENGGNEIANHLFTEAVAHGNEVAGGIAPAGAFIAHPEGITHALYEHAPEVGPSSHKAELIAASSLTPAHTHHHFAAYQDMASADRSPGHYAAQPTTGIDHNGLLQALMPMHAGGSDHIADNAEKHLLKVNLTAAKHAQAAQVQTATEEIAPHIGGVENLTLDS